MKVKAILCALAALVTSFSFSFSAYAEEQSEDLSEEVTEETEEQTEQQEFQSYTKTYYVFNTSATLTLYDDFVEGGESYNAALELGSKVSALLTGLESSLSASKEGSSVYVFNAAEAGERVEIDKHTYNVLQTAYKMYEETEGAYNPAVYYSVDLYGFTARHNGTAAGEATPYDREDPSQELPDERYVQAFQELSTHFSEIELYEENGAYYAVKPEYTVTVEGAIYSLAIDLGGIGKGYAADLVDDLIESYGFENSYFMFGSSSMAINGSATSEDGKWTLNIRNPRGDGYFMTVRVRDVAVSVSGDDNKYYIIDGKRYCHIIDPSTGSPIDTGVITAVCIGGTAAEDDARTTAICAMGKEAALQYMQAHSDLALAFLYYDGDDYYLYTNIDDFSTELDCELIEDGVWRIELTEEEIPSWVYSVIVVGAFVIVIAVVAVVIHFRRKRSAKKAEGEGQ